MNDAVVCSWARRDGAEVIINGLPVLEGRVYKQKKHGAEHQYFQHTHMHAGALMLPVNFVDADEQLPYGLVAELSDAITRDAVRIRDSRAKSQIFMRW